MVVLNKIKGSTLMEVLVASILIVVLYVVSSLMLNNIFKNTLNKQTGMIENKVNKLEYLIKHHKVEIPYSEHYYSWNITVDSISDTNKSIVIIKAENLKKKQLILNEVY